MPLSKGSDGYNKQQCYVMKNHLPDQTLCSIYGPSGSYKSFLAVSWACHIATGVNWAGNKVNQGAVVYIVGEGGIGVSRRVKAWENIYQKEADNLWLVNRPVFPVRRSEISTLVELVKYIEDMSHFPVRLIIFDTLARCFGGKDENDARDMGAFIEGCDSLKIKHLQPSLLYIIQARMNLRVPEGQAHLELHLMLSLMLKERPKNKH